MSETIVYINLLLLALLVLLALAAFMRAHSAARAGDDARFFASREHFWIGHLCNHWSAGVLNAAGLPVRPLRSVTSAEVMATIDRAELDTDAPRD